MSKDCNKSKETISQFEIHSYPALASIGCYQTHVTKMCVQIKQLNYGVFAYYFIPAKIGIKSCRCATELLYLYMHLATCI